MNFSTKKIVYMAFLIALSIVLTRMFSIRIPLYGVEGIRIGFGGLPIILAGIFLGPLAGGIVGATADLLGFWVNPIGAYMPHFTMTAFLTGFIPGFLFYYAFQQEKSYTALISAVGIGQITTSIIMVPYFIHTLFGAPYAPILIPRLIEQPISIVLYVLIIHKVLDYDLIDIPQKIKSTV